MAEAQEEYIAGLHFWHMFRKDQLETENRRI
jgi:hypothetical protein